MERGALLSGGRDARAGFSCLFVVDILVPSAVPCPHQTKRAAGQIKEIMEDEPDMVGLRISVRTRGCSGNAFHLEYATEKNKFDEEIDAYVRGPPLALGLPLSSRFRRRCNEGATPRTMYRLARAHARAHASAQPPALCLRTGPPVGVRPSLPHGPS